MALGHPGARSAEQAQRLTGSADFATAKDALLDSTNDGLLEGYQEVTRTNGSSLGVGEPDIEASVAVSDA
jgi:hypothetical protein